MTYKNFTKILVSFLNKQINCKILIMESILEFQQSLIEDFTALGIPASGMAKATNLQYQ
jgi:hypothetical protein